MLFTPGPDEAIEPVILGLSATFLYVLSLFEYDEKVGPVEYSVLTLAISASIGGLFGKREICTKREDTERPDKKIRQAGLWLPNDH